MARQMTDAMASFLDSLTAQDKRTLQALAMEGAGTTWMRRLIHAAFVETLAAQVREDELIAAMEAEAREDLDRRTEGWVKVWPPDEPPC